MEGNSVLKKGVDISSGRKHKQKLMLLDPKRIDVDGSYQRFLIASTIDRLSKDFNPNALGVLHVCQRKQDRRYYVVDGQHRLSILKQLSALKWVPCIVTMNTTREEEAELFVALNSGRAVAGVSKFRARLQYGAEPETEIQRMVESEGFRLEFRQAGYWEVRTGEVVYGIVMFLLHQADKSVEGIAKRLKKLDLDIVAQWHKIKMNTGNGWSRPHGISKWLTEMGNGVR